MAWQSKRLFIPPLRNTIIRWKRADLSWKWQLAKSCLSLTDSFVGVCKSPVTQITSAQYIIACAEGVHTGLLEEYSISLLLHFIFYVVVSSSYRYYHFLVCPIVLFFFPFFFLYFGLALVGFFSFWLVSGKVICFMACSSCVCVCV